ncbi:polysaccharide pyruvyl transferase family protein [Maribacter aquivivus]|uniref:polysaccharide pyruvyl transferase family protein n=1 Tax=Maribacter aquivivus TaxID=228958 RepID=UPI0024942D78|nr:polysaccharide pyruvyl transferase family protein [Maribacter aquivivus]
MSNKIGIITISRTSNYGAELQAYALQRKLNELGYDAELIDYLYFKHSSHKTSKDSRPDIIFSKKQTFKNFFTYRVISPLVDSLGAFFHSPIKSRLKKFKKFHEEAKTKYSKQYKSYPELKNAKLKYDIFIVGSDQVWNPGTATSLAPYFLEFAPEDKLKMSYASSFGVSEIPKEYYKLYEKYFQNLDHIAVRENQGVNLIKKISGKNATQVLDPTLLLSKKDWSSVCSENSNLPENKYILIYKLHESETLIKYALQLKNQFGYNVYNICKRAFSNISQEGVINLLDAGPAEFIKLFRNAEFVLTTSFHGTAFSVNFRIPFYAVLKPNKANNSRITDFLKNLGLSDRIIWENGEEKIINNNIDFKPVHEKLNKKKMLSLEYLEKTIKSNVTRS